MDAIYLLHSDELGEYEWSDYYMFERSRAEDEADQRNRDWHENNDPYGEKEYTGGGPWSVMQYRFQQRLR